MKKKLISGLLVLAALLIPSLSFANSVPLAPVESQPINSVSVPVIQPLPVDDKVPELWLTGRVSLVGGEVSSSKQQAVYADTNGVPRATSSNFDELVKSGQLVKLEGPNIKLKSDKVIPYVLPSTKVFVLQLAYDFGQAGCGTLGISEALRLDDRRKPKNASPDSVHTRGMAVDIRTKYIPAECADWIRSYVIQKETEGKVDGTQEWKPERLHIVVPLQPRGPSLLQDAAAASVGAPSSD